MLGAIVALAARAMMRVDNGTYASISQWLGLAIRHPNHVQLGCGHIAFNFSNSFRVGHHIHSADKVPTVVDTGLQALPDQNLAQVLNHDGVEHPVIRHDGNDDPRAVSGGEDTATTVARERRPI